MKALKGKLTEQSIDRVSKSYDEIRQIIHLFDLQTGIYMPSGKHSKPNWETDVKELAEAFTKNDLFTNKEGREHKRYPAFPGNILDTLNETDFKQWILTKVMEFKKMNIYKNKSACVFEP